MENIKKPYIKDVTFNDYHYSLVNYIYPDFEPLFLNNITTMEVQRLINKFGETRTAEKIYDLLKQIFTYAVNVDAIAKSPMLPLKKPIHIVDEKIPLSKQEEKEFIDMLFRTNNRYRYIFLVILYTGLRRSELKNAIFREDRIEILSAKQRRGRPEVRRWVPISPMLKRYMPLGEIPQISDDYLTHLFHELCPNHNLHELRHTFNSRARECGIPKELIQKWMGHKPPKKDTNEAVYMHYSDEYQLKEILKFDYDLGDKKTSE